MSCSIPKDNNDSVETIVNLKTHKHTRPCKKLRNSEFRFNVPWSILNEPLGEDFDKNEKSKYNEYYKSIKNELEIINIIKIQISYDEFLKHLKMSTDGVFRTSIFRNFS